MIWIYAMPRRVVLWNFLLPPGKPRFSLRLDRCPALNVCKESRQETLLVSQRDQQAASEEKLVPDKFPTPMLFDPSQDIARIHVNEVGFLTNGNPTYFGSGLP
jgi:hypothetical protein